MDRRLAKSRGKEFSRSELLSSDPITVNYCETWACVVRVFAWGVSRSRYGWFDMYMCRSATQARLQPLGFLTHHDYHSSMALMQIQVTSVFVPRSVSSTMSLPECDRVERTSALGMGHDSSHPSQPGFLIRHCANANCRSSLSIKRLTCMWQRHVAPAY